MSKWVDIHRDFSSLELRKEWKNKGFDYDQVKELIDIGLTPNDHEFAKWMRDKKIFPNKLSDDIKSLKQNYQFEEAFTEAYNQIFKRVGENVTKWPISKGHVSKLAGPLIKIVPGLFYKREAVFRIEKCFVKDNYVIFTLINNLSRDIKYCNCGPYEYEVTSEGKLKIKNIGKIAGDATEMILTESKQGFSILEDAKEEVKKISEELESQKERKFVNLQAKVEQLIKDIEQKKKEVIELETEIAQKEKTIKINFANEELVKKLKEEIEERKLQLVNAEKKIAELQKELSQQVKQCLHYLELIIDYYQKQAKAEELDKRAKAEGYEKLSREICLVNREVGGLEHELKIAVREQKNQPKGTSHNSLGHNLLADLNNDILTFGNKLAEIVNNSFEYTDDKSSEISKQQITINNYYNTTNTLIGNIGGNADFSTNTQLNAYQTQYNTYYQQLTTEIEKETAKHLTDLQLTDQDQVAINQTIIFRGVQELFLNYRQALLDKLIEGYCGLVKKNKSTKLAGFTSLMGITNKLVGAIPGGDVAQAPLGIISDTINLASDILKERNLTNYHQKLQQILNEDKKVLTLFDSYYHPLEKIIWSDKDSQITTQIIKTLGLKKEQPYPFSTNQNPFKDYWEKELFSFGLDQLKDFLAKLENNLKEFQQTFQQQCSELSEQEWFKTIKKNTDLLQEKASTINDKQELLAKIQVPPKFN